MLEDKYLEILEKQDWSVSSYADDGRVEFEKYSPAGEDFSVCVNVENFPEAVMEYYESFDIDDHVEMWIEARKNGVSGVPPTRTLVADAEAIDDMLEHLAYALVNTEVPEQSTWYVEKWYDEDLINALKEIGVTVSKENIERLKLECLHIFDDKSVRNEMLVDKAREIFNSQMHRENYELPDCVSSKDTENGEK
ncbi:hypothetical protein EDD74_11929 [Faecalimonas umbilicata]|uniref:Uncharacterized protein n=1 Tax=Faecalimonas umbilicata TaxID=1912855 RepID=A0A4R3JM94_9FIRM|nr:hypothetical protein [Faecalimonas umbilicata]TCS66131.1 hypothetical protein EDD74_11929 [Faecalimonas umbilicata]GBU06549.1 hypothetical protein FAEUMB_30900 [Faecalimonas umbilicata]